MKKFSLRIRNLKVGTHLLRYSEINLWPRVVSRVADRYLFHTDPDPIRIQSGSRGFDDQKSKKCRVGNFL
jgi:hypothetical protein